MSLLSRRSFAEARIALGSFDRFLLLYGTMFAAFGVASPFLPALLHERGLGPSEIGAVLAVGTAVRLITGPVISRIADRFGTHKQTLAALLAMAAVIAFGYSLPAGFAIFLIVSVAHASTLAPIVPIADAMTLAAAPGRFQYGWVRGGASAAFVVGSVSAGQVVAGDEPRRHSLDERDAARARGRGGALATPKCAGSAPGATARKRSRLVCGAWLLASDGAGGLGYEQPRAARWL